MVFSAMISSKVTGFNRSCGHLFLWSHNGNCNNAKRKLFQRVLSQSCSSSFSSCYSTETGSNSSQQQEQSTSTQPVPNVEKIVDSNVEKKTEKSSFAKAYDKFTGQESFAKLLRNSAFVRMGDPAGKVVEGTIYHIIAEDLYIDVGGKFNVVCLKPLTNPEAYRLGTKVRVLLHDLELSTRFLGAAVDLTILEADGTLLGLSGERKGGQRQRGYIKEEGRSVSEELLSSNSSTAAS